MGYKLCKTLQELRTNNITILRH